jgi:MFS family permease
VFLLMAAAAALTSPRVGRRADRHGRSVVVIVVLLVGSAAMLVTGIVSRAGGPLWLLVAVLVAGFVVLEAGYVPGSALIADGTEQAETSRGELLALANLGWAIGMTGASLAAGIMVTRLGPVAPYLAVAVCALVTVPEFVMIERRTRRS